MQILYETEIYNSRTSLVQHLLKMKKYNKSTIAVEADVSPQLVNQIYTKMVKRKIIDDYYPEFIEKRKEKRLSRYKRRR